jgi:hypothetical protein
MSKTNSRMFWECFDYAFLQCKTLFVLQYYFNDSEFYDCILCMVEHHFIEILSTA